MAIDAKALKEENEKLKKTLRIAIAEAQRNEQILKRFIDIEVRFLACDKLVELIALLLRDFKQEFKLSAVTLFINDDNEMARPLLKQLPAEHQRQLSFYNSIEPIEQLYHGRDIIAGEIDRALRKKVFPDNPFVLSCVLLPLRNKGRLIGSLHLGSRELTRYHADYRYEYLERLSSLLAVCFENCIIHENLAHLSSTDMLTKLFNRHSFDLEIEKAIQRAQRQQQPLSLLFLDIDHFKSVNDTYGHPSGDAILKTFAQIISQQVRNTDFLARFGGEEFAILLPNCDAQQGAAIAENVRLKVATHLFETTVDKAINITTSIGLSCFYPQAHLIGSRAKDIGDTLIQTADEALYEAKHSGRNKVLTKTMLLNPPPTSAASDIHRPLS
ncbi:MAG: DUF484 family protein [Pseudomonadales bacterium]